MSKLFLYNFLTQTLYLKGFGEITGRLEKKGNMEVMMTKLSLGGVMNGPESNVCNGWSRKRLGPMCNLSGP